LTDSKNLNQGVTFTFFGEKFVKVENGDDITPFDGIEAINRTVVVHNRDRPLNLAGSGSAFKRERKLDPESKYARK
jgi:hypothetical protein